MPLFDWYKDKVTFQFGFMGRMIFFCLVDADFQDTGSHKIFGSSKMAATILVDLP